MWTRIGFDTIIVEHRAVPTLRPAPRRGRPIFIDIYTFCLCGFFCFTKAVLHKAVTFGNYSPHPYAKWFLNLLYHTERRFANKPPSFLFPPVLPLSLTTSFSLPLPLFFIFILRAVCTRREKCRLSYANFQNFPRDVYRLSFLLNPTWVRKRESMYVNPLVLALQRTWKEISPLVANRIKPASTPGADLVLLNRVCNSDNKWLGRSIFLSDHTNVNRWALSEFQTLNIMYTLRRT